MSDMELAILEGAGYSVNKGCATCVYSMFKSYMSTGECMKNTYRDRNRASSPQVHAAGCCSHWGGLADVDIRKRFGKWAIFVEEDV